MVAAEPSPRVLITGCSTGIGRALACEFHARGCRVLATARDVSSLSALKEAGMEVAAVDVTAPETIEAAVSRFGDVDVVVANAGVSRYAPLVEQPLAHLKMMLDTNVTGVLATVQATAPRMIARRSGVVVVTGSVSADMVTPYAGAYCASKAAVKNLCAALWMELAPFNVHCVHANTAAVTSSLTDNATAGGASTLTAASSYAPVAAFVEARAKLSQVGSMPAEEYARAVCTAALSETPPREILVGGNHRATWLLGHLPRGLVLPFIAKKLGLVQLRTEEAVLAAARRRRAGRGRYRAAAAVAVAALVAAAVRRWG